MAYPIPSRVPLPTFRPYPDYPQPMLANVSAQAPMGVLSDAAPQVATQPQAPQQPMSFMDKLGQSSDALLAFGSGLLSGRTPNEQWGGGMAALGQGIKDIRSKNLTSEWVKKNAPEYADLVDAGTITPADVFKLKLSNDYTQRAQAAKQYGLDPNTAEGKAFILTGKLPGTMSGDTRYSTQPTLFQKEDGSYAYGTFGSDGTFKPVDTGKYSPVTGIDKADLGSSWGIIDKKSGAMVGTIPKDIAGAEQQKEVGKAQGQATASFPQVEAASNQMLSTIDSILQDPYLPSVTGPIQGRLPNLTGNSQRVQSKIDQLKGQAFLQAYNTLRGGGQITEVEGQKATEAMVRLNQAQNDEDFKSALSELRNIVQTAQERARIRAAGGQQQAPASPGNGATSSGVKWSVE